MKELIQAEGRRVSTGKVNNSQSFTQCKAMCSCSAVPPPPQAILVQWILSWLSSMLVCIFNIIIATASSSFLSGISVINKYSASDKLLKLESGPATVFVHGNDLHWGVPCGVLGALEITMLSMRLQCGSATCAVYIERIKRLVIGWTYSG